MTGTTKPAWQQRIESHAKAAGFRELKCEACGTGLRLRGASSEAWHASCSQRRPRAALPRYVPVNAQVSES